MADRSTIWASAALYLSDLSRADQVRSKKQQSLTRYGVPVLPTGNTNPLPQSQNSLTLFANGQPALKITHPGLDRFECEGYAVDLSLHPPGVRPYIKRSTSTFSSVSAPFILPPESKLDLLGSASLDAMPGAHIRYVDFKPDYMGNAAIKSRNKYSMYSCWLREIQSNGRRQATSLALRALFTHPTPTWQVRALH